MTRSCGHAIEHMYYFLDGETSWYRRIRIRRHLSLCHACTSAFDFETRLKIVIRERGIDEPPPELFEKLRALIAREAGDGTDA